MVSEVKVGILKRGFYLFNLNLYQILVIVVLCLFFFIVYVLMLISVRTVVFGLVFSKRWL